MDDLRGVKPPGGLCAIEEATRQSGFTMASDPRTGALLRALAASKPGGRILELGTGTGIATAWLLDGMDSRSSMVSIDIDGEAQRIAREHLGAHPRLELVTGDAIEYLAQQPAGSFDLLFADAMPGKYDRPEEALRMVRPGGLYVIDDMLPQPNWPDGHAAKVPMLIEWLAGQADFLTAPMAWASGVVVAVRTG